MASSTAETAANAFARGANANHVAEATTRNIASEHGSALAADAEAFLKARSQHAVRPSWKDTWAFPAYSGLLEIV